MADIKADYVIDTKGLNCPMPVLKTKKAIDSLKVGEVLEVMTTDPGARVDIPALVKRLGQELVGSKEEKGVTSFFIRKTRSD